VRVHDVLDYGNHVVLVMEWVEGDTLAAWQDAAPRSWRTVVPVYLQAAHGLAAAHSVGVIHRDFKPANAILGVDGRVRVLDFGLARPADVADEAGMSTVERGRVAHGSGGPTGAGEDSWPSLTATGALVGTLAYAPPEQLEGRAATPVLALTEKRRNLNRPVECLSLPCRFGSGSRASGRRRFGGPDESSRRRPAGPVAEDDPRTGNEGHALGVGRRDDLAACASRRR
jgi:serine/threonine protein kinase